MAGNNELFAEVAVGLDVKEAVQGIHLLEKAINSADKELKAFQKDSSDSSRVKNAVGEMSNELSKFANALQAALSGKTANNGIELNLKDIGDRMRRVGDESLSLQERMGAMFGVLKNISNVVNGFSDLKKEVKDTGASLKPMLTIVQQAINATKQMSNEQLAMFLNQSGTIKDASKEAESAVRGQKQATDNLGASIDNVVEKTKNMKAESSKAAQAIKNITNGKDQDE